MCLNVVVKGSHPEETAYRLVAIDTVNLGKPLRPFIYQSPQAVQLFGGGPDLRLVIKDEAFHKTENLWDISRCLGS